VAGVVFSVTILVLRLASQPFGPRMLRGFIRDVGTQVGLGTYVATFVYAVFAPMATTDPPDAFVPHLSVTVAVALALIDLGVLISFIHHVATPHPHASPLRHLQPQPSRPRPPRPSGPPACPVP
jgi:uncharacterized membrane protein